MKKLTKTFSALLIGLLSLGACKAPTQVVNQKDSVVLETKTISMDTTITTEKSTITVQKLDSGKMEITIDKVLTEIKASQEKTRQQTTQVNEKTVKDDLTPTLKKIDNKAKKDSMKQVVKLEKEHTKQVNGSPSGNLKTMVICAVCIIVIGWLLSKRDKFSDF